mmetsp:Transcript_4515/g.14797  ORF Transcript_4515/g.14797 Transcript_4515/m.14797 type:complete len:208 (+) Transcript_4515:1528-2151(+)
MTSTHCTASGVGCPYSWNWAVGEQPGTRPKPLAPALSRGSSVNRSRQKPDRSAAVTDAGGPEASSAPTKASILADTSASRPSPASGMDGDFASPAASLQMRTAMPSSALRPTGVPRSIEKVYASAPGLRSAPMYRVPHASPSTATMTSPTFRVGWPMLDATTLVLGSTSMPRPPLAVRWTATSSTPAAHSRGPPRETRGSLTDSNSR